MRDIPLSFFIEKIEKEEPFSMIRFGDGEFNCMWGIGTENCDGSKYSPQLAYELRRVLSRPRAEGFYIGMQRILPKDKERALKEFPNVDWFDSEIFADAIIKGEIQPFIDVLHKKDVTIVGNSRLRQKIRNIFPKYTYVTIPEKDAWLSPFELPTQNKIILFSAGWGSNLWIEKYHNQGFILLDVGHIWDTMLGDNTRGDILPS